MRHAADGAAMTYITAEQIVHATPAPGWDRDLFARRRIRRVLDVGANIGGFIPAWLTHGAEIVHAIEPVPSCFEKLHDRFRFDPRVVCHQIGVSAERERLHDVNVFNAWTLQRNDAKTFHRAFDFVTTPPFDVELQPIDFLLERWGFAPDFIKIDVDGYDVRALRGARDYIQSHRPVLMLEISYMPEVALGDCYACELRLLRDHGYQFTTVNGGRRLDWKDLLRAFPWDSSYDLICEPEGSPA
jgi:FkbM family methyltransferase